ncbi:uncharacterized protein METZ01_LOCUS385854, partial [marine metagenome]
MPYSDLIYYYICKIPSVAFYMAPQAVLFATVVTLAVLARDNEITAMKAGGIGVVGITLPIVGASFVIALLVLASNEYVVPTATKKMNYIFKVKVQGNQKYGDTYVLKEPSAEQLWFVA